MTKDTLVRFAGYYAQHTIRDLLRSYPSFVEGTDCVVTCIDSNPRTSQKYGKWGVPTLGSLGEFEVVAGSVILAHANQIFPGFDEFFVFEPGVLKQLTAFNWPRHYTSERAHFVQYVPESLERAFRLYGALRYASDGDGLNYIASDVVCHQKLQRAMASAYTASGDKC